MSVLQTLFSDVHPLRKYVLTCAPSPPPPPDYAGAAQAQGAANVEAARTQGKLNNPNVYNPYGSQVVTWNGDQPSIWQTFSPAQQQLFNASNQTKLTLSNLANKGANVAGDVIGKNLDLSGLPARPGSSDELRGKVIDAMMARVNEDADRRQGLMQSNLLAAGIPTSSKAYQDAMALDERTRTDAANQAYLAAGQEAQRNYNMDAQTRQQALAELMAQRQAPLNEITALMSGSQVSNPFSMPGYAQNQQVAPAPVFGATQALSNYNTDLYNAKAAQMGNLQSGLFGLGGAGIGAGALLMA